MKKHFSKEATHLLLNLLEKDPTLRLGFGERDAEEIKEHPFFADINWEKLERWEIKPFFIPKIKNKKDLKYIDWIFTDEIPVDTPVESSHLSFIQKKEKHFPNFTYSKETVLQNKDS